MTLCCCISRLHTSQQAVAARTLAQCWHQVQGCQHALHVCCTKDSSYCKGAISGNNAVAQHQHSKGQLLLQCCSQVPSANALCHKVYTRRIHAREILWLVHTRRSPQPVPTKPRNHQPDIATKTPQNTKALLPTHWKKSSAFRHNSVHCNSVIIVLSDGNRCHITPVSRGTVLVQCRQTGSWQAVGNSTRWATSETQTAAAVTPTTR